MESWFLADTEAMRRWLGDDTFCEATPETLGWNALGSAERCSAAKRVEGRGQKFVFRENSFASTDLM